MSLAIHAVVLYLVINWKIDVRIIDFKHERTDVLLVAPPEIKFTAGLRGGSSRPSGQAEAPAAVRETPASAGGGQGTRGQTAAGGRTPLVIGGTPGEILTPEEREKRRELASGFSLVYPADAMLNLSKYAQAPEDELLRSFRSSLRPAPDLSKYIRPPAGKSSFSISPGTGGGVRGGGGIAGGIGTIKPPPEGVVAAFVPDDVKTFDLSGWASEILNAVQRHWTMGVAAGAAEWSGRVTYTILVMASGELNAVELAASSGLAPLDAAALKAIEGSGPWPALPEGFPGTSLELQLVFKYGK